MSKQSSDRKTTARRAHRHVPGLRVDDVRHSRVHLRQRGRRKRHSFGSDHGDVGTHLLAELERLQRNVGAVKEGGLERPATRKQANDRLRLGEPSSRPQSRVGCPTRKGCCDLHFMGLPEIVRKCRGAHLISLSWTPWEIRHHVQDSHCSFRAQVGELTPAKTENN